MQTSGTITVSAPRAQAYAFISDPRRLAACIPGCTDLRELAPGTYAAVLGSKVGFITVRFDVTVEITKQEPNEAIEATITGKPMGLAGRLEARAAMTLADSDAGATAIRYAVELGLTGKLGGIGQPVFTSKSEQLAREFGDNLRAAIEGSPR
ncbi:MAG: CoxG family protein [Candidatus Velthaea sp.]